MTKAKIRIMTTAIILPLTSLPLRLAVLTQAAIKMKYIKYTFFLICVSESPVCYSDLITYTIYRLIKTITVLPCCFKQYYFLDLIKQRE